MWRPARASDRLEESSSAFAGTDSGLVSDNEQRCGGASGRRGGLRRMRTTVLLIAAFTAGVVEGQAPSVRDDPCSSCARR